MPLRLSLKILNTVHKLSAKRLPTLFPLLDLPNELIALVVEQIEGLEAARRLARTCRRLQHLVEPILYRSLVLRIAFGSNFQLHKLSTSVKRKPGLLSALCARPERSAAIHRLAVPCHDGGHGWSALAMPDLLARAKNLRDLLFESPECNGMDFEDDAAWQVMADEFFAPFQHATRTIAASPALALTKSPLQNLRKLTLHFNGPASPYWAFDERSIAILFLPALRHLHISCVNIYESIKDFAQDRTSASLRHLVLEECNITHKGLSAILSIPQALESFHLGENCHNIFNFSHEIDINCNYLFQTDSLAVMRALQKQKDSLASLEYATTGNMHQAGNLARRRPIQSDSHFSDGSFATFSALEHVTLTNPCPEFERALMTSRSPPNLKTLTYRAISPLVREKRARMSGNQYPFAFVPFLRVPACSIPPKLRALNVIYSAFPVRSYVDLSDMTKEIIRSAAVAAANIRGGSGGMGGITLTVSCSITSQFYPPFLLNEPRPVEELLYGGTEVGFVGRCGVTGKGEGADVVVVTEEEFGSDDEVLALL